MTHIALQQVSRRFGAVQAVDGVSLDFPGGSFTALLGPSGCGKSTLLRLIAGFEAPDAGTIRFGDQIVAEAGRQVPPEKRGVGIVFQSYALWPHMDVAGNVAYPLKTRGVERQAVETRVAEVLAIVGLEGYGARKVDELSGGQRQRVALARCLVADTGIILFDEPLANLDMHLRATMVDVFREIHRRTRATIVYVTHDQAEALALADRVAVLDRGRLLQVAHPSQVYRSPADATVAGFVGRGAIVRAEVVEPGEGMVTVDVGRVRFPARGDRPANGPVRVLLRPEGLRPAETGLPAVVTSTIYRGPVHEVRLALGTGEEIALDASHPPAVGERIHVSVSDAWIIPGV